MNGRMLPAWGTGLDYTVPNREKVEIFLDEQELLKPLKWRKSKKIFPCSMTDWCADFVTDEMRDRMLAVAALCPQHTFLFLTKRAERCAKYFDKIDSGCYVGLSSAWCNHRPMPNQRLSLPLPNVLLGFSAENQECFDARWNAMRPLAAAGWNVWCSAEPLLGPINISKATIIGPEGGIDFSYTRSNMLSWLVVGGESGPGARPMNVAWVRSIIRQCADAGVPCFVKQVGAFPVVEPCRQHHYDFGSAIGREAKFSALDKMHPSTGMWRWHPKDRKGGDMSEWPEDLRVRQFPEVTR
jgi:protein gp37